MGKYSFRIFLVMMLALFAACAQVRGEQVAVEGKGSLENVDGVRVLRLEGSPHEMGLQHGKLLKKEIIALMNYFFVEKENIFGASPETVQKGAEILKNHIPDAYISEMQGIAEGSGVEFEKILLMNTFLDTVSAAWVNKGPRCSNFAAMGAATPDGAVVHGRNLDWASNDFLSSANTVIYYTPDDGIPFVALSWPGMNGTLTGMNVEKITMGEMTSMHPDATLEGTPIMTQLRMLLQYSTNLDEAFAVLKDNPRTTGYNVLVTDGKVGDAFVVEMNAEDIFRTGPRDGLIHHTNHYTHPKLSKTQEKMFYIIGKGKESDTFYRYDRLKQLLEENSGNINVDNATSFLSDKYDLKENKIDETMKRTVCRENTLQSVVMLPASGDFYVGLKGLPAPDGGYVKLHLDVKE